MRQIDTFFYGSLGMSICDADKLFAGFELIITQQ